ncbi:NADPH-dependent F420 reductase [Brachybacterium squillarum]|uniref:NADPH-dependent F420 reductase n=1 Tax=Brachybacterium squillarum TaxID=661979 RepID=UPI002223E864|nr:NADPH-dependent F420 reductase [Brachybacterium squillarum]MCW1804602.1 NADPH-dependent F420 reductase [Brachybacterium squillarum]
MTTVSIFGTGSMATAIAGVLAKGGADIQHVAHADAASATLAGDVVVLAVPHPAVAEILDTHAEQLAGKVVVDITNPLDFSTFDSLVVPADSSAAAQIQSALPTAKVLKAFNTNFAATLASGTVGALTTTVLVAGDDDAAKQTLLGLVREGGLEAADAGALSRARELEAVGFLQLTLAAGEKISWTGGFGLAR